MPNHEQIYRNQAEQYEEMISRQESLLEVIRSKMNPDGCDVIDLGAGTGRLTRALLPAVRSIVSVDQSPAMLGVLKQKLSSQLQSNWRGIAADYRSVPLPDGCADLITAGWSICYTASSNHADWETNVERVYGEIKRLLRPGGTAIIFETMGTGAETPEPPAYLLPYYEKLERHYGFQTQWLRTDYSFDSVEQAVQFAEFFFGQELAARISEHGWRRLPECCGVWWKAF
ncbi:class I SAM-dependent methyltransferase [Paenibacillus turpanensis]|uniref:class I SAM-dependent methyltransferase n=1 Tax=Paenibacillus turpanensis TaxID=2689078 RepID=UPI00140D21D5|nr:class I SAM-dependent methyltransferase [Paenibacillus turpanensis]